MINLSTIGTFTWNYGSKFFVETAEGNYIWSDPDYNGDNTMIRFDGTYKDWIKSEGIDYGRDKGHHVISEYCGPDVKFVA